MKHAIRIPDNRTDTYGVGTAFPLATLTRFRVQYQLPAGDSLAVYLVEMNRSNGQTTILDQWTSSGGSPDFPTTGGTFSSVAFTPTHNLDPSSAEYFLHLDMQASSVATTSVAVAAADYRLKTFGLLGS